MKTRRPLEGRRRILVVGCGGAGKSTFSRALGRALNLPVVHLDAHFWREGWREPEKKEWRGEMESLVRGESWILDGNYGGTMDLRFSACDAAVFLDTPRLLCLWRVVKRRIRFAGISRPDMAPGCPERLERAFLEYIWNYPKSRRPGILQKLENLPEEKATVVLRPEEVWDFLNEVGGRSRGARTLPRHSRGGPG